MLPEATTGGTTPGENGTNGTNGSNGSGGTGGSGGSGGGPGTTTVESGAGNGATVGSSAGGGEGLPFTGMPVGPVAAIGGALTAAGATLRRLVRRR